MLGALSRFFILPGSWKGLPSPRRNSPCSSATLQSEGISGSDNRQLQQTLSNCSLQTQRNLGDLFCSPIWLCASAALPWALTTFCLDGHFFWFCMLLPHFFSPSSMCCDQRASRAVLRSHLPANQRATLLKTGRFMERNKNNAKIITNRLEG